MQTITKLREKIDKVDEKLVKLLGERFSLTRQIGTEKIAEKRNILDSKREEAIMTRMQKIGKESGLSGILIRNIWGEIFAQSRKEQEENE